MRNGPSALVIGVGNILWADEGFGVRCAEAFAASYALPHDAEVMDGGTQGLALVSDLAAARRVLIFDAVDAGLAPAELVTVRGDDVPRFVAGKKVSLHQTSMMEVLALAELMGDGPPEALTLIGCQPVELEDYGGGLTPQMAQNVTPAVEAAAAELRRWGLAVTQRQDAAAEIMPGAVARHLYEGGRPRADLAYRHGDERVLARLLVGKD